MAPIRVALTFDAEHADRPNPGGTEQLLEVLAAAATRATFFLQGRWVESVHRWRGHWSTAATSSAVTAITTRACRISPTRGSLTTSSAAEEAIRQTCGVDPRPWFRCPFGDGASDPRVLGAIAAAGYRHVGWHVDGEDWAEDATAEGLERRVREGIRGAGDGAVVLLHGWPAVTPTAVERLLASAADDGVTYVGIDELGVAPVETVPW